MSSFFARLTSVQGQHRQTTGRLEVG